MGRKEDGVDATSRKFAHYDQVDKPRDYQLAEHGQGEQFDDDYVIRSLDLGEFVLGDEAARKRFSREFGGALQDIGFAILVNTGVEPTLYDEAEQRVIEFFESVPLEE